MVDIWLLTHGRHPDRDPPVMMRRVEVSIPGAEEVEFVDARVAPRAASRTSSQPEIDRLLDSSRGGLYPLSPTLRARRAELRRRDRRRARASSTATRDFELQHRAPGLGHQPRDAQRAGHGVRRRPDDPRHQGAPVRGAARHRLHPGEVYEHGSVELHEPQGITNAVFRVLRNAHAAAARARPTSSCAGAATRSAATNTSTPRRSATNSACAASTSAPAAGRAR